MTIIKNPDDTYTLTLLAEEQAIMDDVELEFGPEALSKVIRHWLEGRQEIIEERQRRLFRQQFESLTEPKQTQVRDLLEGRA